MGLHQRYATLLEGQPLDFIAGRKEEEEKIRTQLSELFDGMMQTLFRQQGAHLDIEVLETPKMQEFIEAHASVLDSSFEKVKMSDLMRRRLTRSNYIFSGMKTFHELNEAFPSLLDEDGSRKPFERFLNDVRKIDEKYNGNYLRAEYNFVVSSAEMAARWEGFMEDGDRYHLQYRTANDGKVRPEHAAMHGITLPPSDSFWEEFYPPNGWNCRCTVVQVRKSKYPATDHDEAISLGELATGKDSKGIFRFNPGKEQKTVPDYNPYTIRRCRDCDQTKLFKFARHVSDNELCAACQLLRERLSQRDSHRPTSEEFNRLRDTVIDWADNNLDIAEIPGAAQGSSPMKRTYVETSDSHRIGVGKKFFAETMHKNKRNVELADIAEVATKFKEWVPNAVQIRTEPGEHHDFEFSVYTVVFNGRTIEFKCKITDGELLYNMRFI